MRRSAAITSIPFTGLRSSSSRPQRHLSLRRQRFLALRSTSLWAKLLEEERVATPFIAVSDIRISVLHPVIDDASSTPGFSCAPPAEGHSDPGWRETSDRNRRPPVERMELPHPGPLEDPHPPITTGGATSKAFPPVQASRRRHEASKLPRLIRSQAHMPRRRFCRRRLHGAHPHSAMAARRNKTLGNPRGAGPATVERSRAIDGRGGSIGCVPPAFDRAGFIFPRPS